MSKVFQESSGNDATWIGIDLLRGILAIMVVLGHAVTSSEWLNHVKGGEEMQTIPAIILDFPGYWVCGFFILSGFCIHRSIMGMRDKGGAFAWPYTIARVTRLYPIYLVAILLMGLSWSIFGPYVSQDESVWKLKILGHLLMLQGMTGTIHELGPSWSITYEAVYYLVWPLFLIVCGWKKNLALILSCGVMLIASATVVVIWKVTAGGAGDSWMIPFWLIPSQFILWAGGAFLAEKWAVILPRVRSWWMPVSLLGILGGSVGCSFLDYYHARQWMLISASYAILPFWLGLIASFTVWRSARKWTGIANILGLLSYPLYILHQIFLDGLVRMLPGYGLWTDVILLTGFAVTVSLLFGVPLEMKAMKWRKKILAKAKEHALVKPTLQESV